MCLAVGGSYNSNNDPEYVCDDDDLCDNDDLDSDGTISG